MLYIKMCLQIATPDFMSPYSLKVSFKKKIMRVQRIKQLLKEEEEGDLQNRRDKYNSIFFVLSS